MSTSLERLLRVQLFIIYALNIADYFLTVAALADGHSEANPVMAPLAGTVFMPVVKFLLMPILLLIMWRIRHRIGRPLVFATWIPVLSYTALMFYYGLVIYR